MRQPLKRIEVNDVSKRFRLHRERPTTFRELIPALFSRRSSTEDLWALQGVSFEAGDGETLGIIGRNGSGKSTLLKLLSGIMQPTRGTLAVHGRVGALIELGAGFHPEFTGRENIFLNGSILGMRRAEVQARLDRIVAFAELERFVDTPVKHYSSGMYMRLGFAIAIHSEPDVLLVDEVLAVGDEAFQRKCLQRIEKLREDGKTIVIVSHNLEQVARLCNRAVWLDAGYVLAVGPARDVVDSYVEGVAQQSSGERNGQDRRASADGPAIEIAAVRTLDRFGKPSRLFATGDRMAVELRYVARERVENPVFGVAVHRSDGVYCYGTNTLVDGIRLPDASGTGTISLVYDSLRLLGGLYTLDVGVFEPNTQRSYHFLGRICQFQITAPAGHQGICMLDHEWRWQESGQA